MHDVAQEVVGKKICTVKSIDGDIDKKVRHLSLTQSESSNFVSNKTHIRSYLQVDFRIDKSLDQFYVDALIANWKYLRALDLSRSNIKSLPGSIGDLIHLRYLDLGYNSELEALPESITKLYNLQTLVLIFSKLKFLPKDLRKLVKLRVLELGDCDELKYMPRGLGMLTCLHTLDMFVVGGISLSTKEVFDELDDLKAFTNLRGFINIRTQFMKTSADTYKIIGGRKGGCLGNKEHLKEVCLSFVGDEEVEGREEYDEAMMEALQPKYTNLTYLFLQGYRGVRIPNWVREDNLATIFPNLDFMVFEDCLNLQYLGHLRYPRLEILFVENCPNLSGILECPALQRLELSNFNDRLEIINIGSNLKTVRIDNLAWLDSLRFQSGANKANMKTFACLSSLKVLEIKNSSNSSLSMVAAVREVPFCHSLRSLTLTSVSHMPNLPNWISHLTALQCLDISFCKELESMPNWMSKLTSLRKLTAYGCSARLKERCQESTGEDWPHIQHIPSILI
ncbi:putative disease resistance protein RGA1 [Chenopodium quinoa]|uniref:putative disease resistance protein RGA1 n=1 Tax=Chenopodium quinoa TaxID=63459 RepID=UPI000B7702E4|nr:putative disease resistance protein RGA1 [Chenopodium quinoa]